MKEWKIIYSTPNLHVFKPQDFSPVERDIAAMEKLGWTIFSVTGTDTVNIMIVCWRMKP